MTEIKLENVSYAYDEQQILKDINLEVKTSGGFLVFQFRSQTKAFFIFRLRRIVILHTERASVDPKREKRNDKGAKTYDVPKHLFSCIFDVQQ